MRHRPGGAEVEQAQTPGRHVHRLALPLPSRASGCAIAGESAAKAAAGRQDQPQSFPRAGEQAGTSKAWPAPSAAPPSAARRHVQGRRRSWLSHVGRQEGGTCGRAAPTRYLALPRTLRGRSSPRARPGESQHRTRYLTMPRAAALPASAARARAGAGGRSPGRGGEVRKLQGSPATGAGKKGK